MLKMKYEFLYKSGFVEEVIQELTDETAQNLGMLFYEALANDKEGIVTLGDGDSEGYFIRLSDISRVKVSRLN